MKKLPNNEEIFEIVEIVADERGRNLLKDSTNRAGKCKYPCNVFLFVQRQEYINLTLKV